MDLFFSCDWGTSSLRLRLASSADFKIIAEEKSDTGISATFNLWKERNEREEKRFEFYLSILKEKLERLQSKVQFNVENIPLVISGMASSTIGMIDIPYKPIPASIEGSGLIVKILKSTVDFPHDMIIISGLRSDNDVMRGEETQLIGAIESETGGLYIFPGTHSKHLRVEESTIVGFKTYMTGEFFHLLTTKSILSSSVDATALFGAAEQDSFRRGVQDAQTVSILHGSFMVRTNLLFDKYSKQENFYYLSGLLIGSELKEINPGQAAVFLIGSKEQCWYYQLALNALYRNCDVVLIDADEATIKGHCKIYSAIQRQTE